MQSDIHFAHTPRLDNVTLPPPMKRFPSLLFVFRCADQNTPMFALCVCLCVSVSRLFHRLKIGCFSCSLAELFLTPLHSCSVSGI